MADHALKSFQPPKRLSVSEWADNYRVLTKDESSFAGTWQTQRVPYLKAIMDAFTKETIESITLLKATQIGATEAGINMVGYTIDRDPSRILYILPDADLAKDFSNDRLQKALLHCPSVAEKFDVNNSKNQVLRFEGGFVKLEGAQSPGKLASWSVPKVIMDEIDKYPQWTGREASPLKLAKERTKNWPDRKIALFSTPTTEQGNIYQAYLAADVRYKFYMPCPVCGKWQTFDFENVKIPKRKGKDFEPLVARKEAYYQCPACHAKINDTDKKEMLTKGKWVADKQIENPRNIAFHINSLYSPWVTFGDVAEEFVRSKDEPSKLMNFVNSWLGEPWKPKAASVAATAIMHQKTNIPQGLVPKWAKLLTGGVDCQKGYFYWVIRAWGANMTSQLIANGQAMTWGDINTVMDQNWPIEDSQETMQVNLYCVDSGYNTEEAYEYCYQRYPYCVPVKGASHAMIKPFNITQLRPRDKWVQPQVLYVLDTDQYKNMMFARIAKDVNSAGSWRINADTTREYADMITSEQKIITEKDGRSTETWQQITSSKPNHYLDCEVYAAAAADIMNVRALVDEDTQEIKQEEANHKVDEHKFINKDFKLER